MPWSNNSGGNGGGPWGGGGGGGGPWGGGDKDRDGNRNRPDPANIDELFRNGADRMRTVFGGGGGGRGPQAPKLGGFGWGAVALAALVAYGFMCAYTVQTNEQAVVIRLGKPLAEPRLEGLHFRIWPIEQVEKVGVTKVNREDIGFRSGADRGRPDLRQDVLEEGLMLTGDENIIDIQFSVLWQIKDAKDYLFNVANPDETVKAMAESAMREVVGRNNAEYIRAAGRQEIVREVHRVIQGSLDEYGAGIVINQVQLDKADPPPKVIDAFKDVQTAQQDLETARNEADKYRNQRLAESRGLSVQLVQEAEAYKAQVLAEAQGEASRFGAIYGEYVKNPELVRTRLHLETVEKVLGGMPKIILGGSGDGGSGVVPYLPLNELVPKPGVDAARGSELSPKGVSQ